MDNRRKRVAILSQSETFSRALRLRLHDCEVEAWGGRDHVSEDFDVLVARLDDGLDSDWLQAVSVLVPTLVVTNEMSMLEVVDAGVRGFLPDSASLDEIHDAVKTIAEGGAVVPPNLLGTVLRHLVDRQRRDDVIANALDQLTDRERQVFRLAAQGARKEEIGDRLFISPATARTHLQRVYKKLKIHSQAELMALAMRVGEFPLEDET